MPRVLQTRFQRLEPTPRHPLPSAERPLQKSALWCILPVPRRGDREAEGARLEIVCTERYRGFESLPLRHFLTINNLPSEVTAGSRATDRRELRQARKGAAAAAPAVCRGSAWLSPLTTIIRNLFSKEM